MVVLHIDLSPKAGLDEDLRQVFLDVFRPAVEIREGFQAVTLLHRIDSDTGFRVELQFESEAKRQDWVASEAHVVAWQSIEQCCEAYATALFDEVN